MPSELDRAVEERNLLSEEASRLQEQLRKANLELKTTMPLPAYQRAVRRKAELGEAYREACERLRKAKAKCTAILDSRRDANRNVVGDWEGTIDMARSAFTDLWAYVAFLQSRVKELEAENERLRETPF